MMNNDDIEEIKYFIKNREPLFHNRTLTNTREEAEREITDDFWEVGASGAIYSKEFVLDILGKRYENSQVDEMEIEDWKVYDFDVTELADDCYLATYTLEGQDRLTRRSTIWKGSLQSGFKAVYHQGTVIQEPNPKMSDERVVYDETLLRQAEEIARRAHAGQVDKGGHPYINHPMAVANALEKTEEKIVAYLHDVLEDSDYTSDKLLKVGFPLRIVCAVEILTKSKDVSYFDYLNKVKDDGIAQNVKKADLKHNMDITRISNPTQKDYERMEKYKEALRFLESD